MATIPSIEPYEIRAGDTVKWTKSYSDYSSQEWTLTYTIYNATSRMTVTATSEDDGSFSVTVSADTTANWPAGSYKWIARVSNGSETYTIESGNLTILPNPTSATDERSHVKKVLDALEAAIEGRASRTDLSYQIGDKQIMHMSPEELYKAWRRYKMLYQHELVEKGLSEAVGTTVKVRFV